MNHVTVRDLIGIPYRRYAAGPDAFDCWGLCLEVLHRFGHTVPDWQAPGGCEAQQVWVQDHLEEFDPVSDPIPGDLVLFAQPHEQRGMTDLLRYHGGVVLTGGRFIHCPIGHSVRIERLDAENHQPFIQGFYRWPR